MQKLPLKKGIYNYTELSLVINEIIEALMWICPTLNPDIGTIVPTAQFLRAGTLAWADGTNWDPGSGEGLYRYTGATWSKVG